MSYVTGSHSLKVGIQRHVGEHCQHVGLELAAT